MTETTKEIFEKYQVRKTEKQKAAFRAYTKQIAERYGYAFRVEKGSFGSKNIVIGDPDTAKVLYTAHYDTCARLPFPNFITPKNFLIYLLYQLLLVAVIFAVAYVPGFVFSFISAKAEFRAILSFLPLLICYVLLFLMLCGPANKHTANDNTSGVTTLFDIMQALPEEEKSKVAFVFFDLEEAGLFGSSSFASQHKGVRKQTLVINFDCVSDGQTILFALKRTTKQYAQLLQQAFVPTPDITVEITANAFYPSDNASFKGGIGVAALKSSKLLGTLYMNRIHTERDVIYREENIQFLTQGAIRLAQML